MSAATFVEASLNHMRRPAHYGTSLFFPRSTTVSMSIAQQSSNESTMAAFGRMAEPFSSDLLAVVVPLACTQILPCANAKKPLPSRLGGRIATVLHIVAAHLNALQPYQLHPTAQDLSRRALQDLLKMCKWSAKPAASKAEDFEEDYARLLSLSSRGVYDELNVLLSSQPKAVRAGIVRFLAAKQTDLEFYANRFQELCDLLEPDHLKFESVDQSSLYSRHLKPGDEYTYPDSIRENLITALKEHAKLYLSTKGRNVKQLVEFDLVMASAAFEFWQDFSLRVASNVHERPEVSSDPMIATKQPDNEERQTAVMNAGDVCNIFERHRNSQRSIKLLLEPDYDGHLHRHKRAHPLPNTKWRGKGLSLATFLESGQYDLSLETKITLAFAVARSFWEFYGSELSMARWSSEDIWFRPWWNENPKSSGKPKLKAFVGFPFGQDSRSPDEFLEVDDLTHIYPRILSLGIILLEIWCGEKLGIPPLIAHEDLTELRNSVNDAHSKAISQLAALNNEFSEVSKQKEVFGTAISSCLDPSKFIESHSTRKRRSKLSPEEYEKLSPQRKAVEDQRRTEYQRRAVQDRQEAIYRNVVAPLYWLAKFGHDDGSDDMFIEPRKQQHAKVRCRSIFSDDTDKAKVQEFWNHLRTATFDSDEQVEGRTESWFEDIRTISQMVFLQRRKIYKETGVKLTPVRIAILDAGCDLTLKSFQAAKCFKGWRDFTVETSSEAEVEPPEMEVQLSATEVDEYGHGTFMARLVVQMLPDCELYIARVAQTTAQLERNEKAVAKAIRHAGKVWEVDVISMSFSFPKSSRPIGDAIKDVRNAREEAIIFLASAGNDVNDAEAYPACDPSVISMCATKSTGAFLETNPHPSEASGFVLGTYGDNVPEAVLEELRARFTQGKFSAGTSVATAVAAGIVGQMLAYAALLPYVLRGCGAEALCNELKTTDGMRCMLFHMAKSSNGRQFFINPIRFWKYNSDDPTMYRKMCKAMPLREV